MKAILVECRRMYQEIMKVIAETEEYLIVDKPHGLPTVPLKKDQHSPSLLREVGSLFPEVEGDSFEGYTLHRLDTATRGLVLFARTEESYRYYQDMQKRGEIRKGYLAYCSRQTLGEGYPPFSPPLQSQMSSLIRSRFRPWGRGRREVRPVTDFSHSASLRKGGEKEYTTVVRLGPLREPVLYRVDAELVNGFRHQVRSHLAWAGYPILGDSLYGGLSCENLQLFAVSLTFHDRNKGCSVEYSIEDPPVPIISDKEDAR